MRLSAVDIQSSQPTSLRELSTIQPTRSYTRSFFCLAVSRPPLTSHRPITFSNRAIGLSITAPRLWNDLPSELRTFSLLPPSSSQITRHYLLPAPLSVTSGLFTRNRSSISSKTLNLTHLILFLSTLRLNSTRL